MRRELFLFFLVFFSCMNNDADYIDASLSSKSSDIESGTPLVDAGSSDSSEDPGDVNVCTLESTKFSTSQNQ